MKVSQKKQPLSCYNTNLELIIMKKTLIFAALIILGFGLAGCDMFVSQTTTAETSETITVDSDNYIEISTVAELQEIEMNLSYKLIADLDISSVEWEPLGDYNDPYLGNFDGNGHTITGLTITDQNNYFNGLFGYVKGDISDLILTNVNIAYQADFLTYVGAVAGLTFGGDIKDCQVEGQIDVENTESNTFAGLLVGYSQPDLDNTTTYDSFERNTIEGNQVSGTILIETDAMAYIGGLIGKTFNSQIVGNLAETTIEVVANGVQLPVYVGGLIGHNYAGILLNFSTQLDDANIYIENNISFTDITVTNTASNIYMGGFMGFTQESFTRNNYSEANLAIVGTMTETNTIRVGGYLAENFDCQVEDSIAVSNITSQEFDSEAEIDNYVAGVFTMYVIDNVYLIITGTNTDSLNEELVTDYDFEDLDATFFEDNLDWTSEFYNQIIE